MSAPLSIGIVCFPSLGGSGVVASEIAVGLAGRGHSIHLLASATPSRALPERDGVRLHIVAVPDHPLLERGSYGLAVASKIVNVCREHRLDLVQVHYAVPHAASAFVARHVLGASSPAFVTSLHGTDVTRLGEDPAYHSVTSFAVTASDGVTAPSEFLRGEAYRRLELPRTRPIEVIPNFCDTERFAPPERRDRARLARLFEAPENGPILFHVSTFRAVKRAGDLMEALARIRRTVPARLVLVGDGPERAAAEERAAALGVRESVRFLGRRLDFVEDLKHADAFLLTSESESFGVAALEALSAGVPVFAYRVGGLPEVVAEGTGRLVEPFDVDALARAVLDVITVPETRSAFGRAARARVVAHFGREPALDRYEAYFRRVLAHALEEPS